MSLFGRKKHNEDEADRQWQIEQQRAAARQYDDLVRDALERLLTWAYPYSQIDGWDIWHVDARGRRIVDVRVKLEFDDGQPRFFTTLALMWGDTDIENSGAYADVALTAPDLYDALRRVVTEGA
jgi:hypothetical protein